jgi:hypothetical protein
MVAAGRYSLIALEPPSATVFARRECYNIHTGNATVVDVTTLSAGTSAVNLPLGSTVTCVAVYDVFPRLALLSWYPAAYTAANTSTLAAGVSGRGLACVTSPSARVGVNNASITAPGAAGLCGVTGAVAPAHYSFGQTNTPLGTSLSHWECYSINRGTATLLTMTSASSAELRLNTVVTCIAVYGLLPQLSLLSHVAAPAAMPYSQLGGNLTAVGPSNSNCSKPQSDLVSARVNVTSPGVGAQCGATAVAVGQYTLSQVAPAGTMFLRWECYNITGGSEGTPLIGARITIMLNELWTCVASEWGFVLRAGSPV